MTNVTAHVSIDKALKHTSFILYSEGQIISYQAKQTVTTNGAY